MELNAEINRSLGNLITRVKWRNRSLEGVINGIKWRDKQKFGQL